MRFAVSLGSNLGDREANLRAGRDGLAARGVIWTAVSALYETEPVGPVRAQPPFLNQAAVGVTTLSPEALLAACQEVERESGRVRDVRWGPRTLDLDILLLDSDRIALPDLTVPHPEMANRAFVLVPLAEIAPDWVVPVDGETTVREMRDTAPGREGVRLWQSSAMKPPI